MDRSIRHKRNRFELFAALLESSRGGARKTTLMFRANLSFALLNKYLSFLTENGFLEKHDELYFPSQRALAYLHRYSRYQRARHDLIRTEEVIHSILPMAGKRGRAR